MRLYHYLEAKWALDDIRRRRLKVSKVADMNDPYEWKCARSSDRSSQLALEQTMNESAKKYSGLCFSRSWNNILMWSHYAEKHKGVCLGFDVPDHLTRDVQYIGDLLVKGDLSLVPADEKTRLLELLYWAKYKNWCYEEEVRVYASREDKDEETGQYFVNFGENLRLKEVIAGASFPMSKRPIEDALKGYSDDVKIIKARKSTERFEITVDESGFNMACDEIEDMQSWEYKWEPVANFTLDYRKHLNELGEEGWEFAGLFPGESPTAGQKFVLFKRPKPSMVKTESGVSAG